VSLGLYTPGAVTLEEFVTSVFQLKIGTAWLPAEDGADRVPVLPGQMFRIWPGVEKAHSTDAAQVRRLLGGAGKLILAVNGRTCEFGL